MIKNPDLQPEYVFEAGPKGPRIHDGDKKRSTMLPSESSDSDSSESEEEKLQEELLKLI